MLILAAVGIGALIAGLVLAGWAARTRQRHLTASDIVEIDGQPYVLHALAPGQLGQWGFEPLGEMLARTVIVDPPLTLYEALAKAGWKPPPPDQRPMVL